MNKIPTKTEIKSYFNRYNPAGLRGAEIVQNLTPTANNHFNWLLEKKGKRYVLRIAKPGGNMPSNIVIEYLVLRHLEDSGLVPRPYWIDTTNFMNPLLIEEFVEGARLGTKPTLYDLQAVARSLARLHQQAVPAHFPLEDRSYRPRLNKIILRIEQAITQPLVREVTEQCGLLKLMPRIEKFLQSATMFADKKRRVLLHGDMYLGNVILKNDEAVLIDWQKPALGEPTFDFGNLFVDVTWRSYYAEFRDDFLEEYLGLHRYASLRQMQKLFDLRMIERDITSLASELKEAAQLPQKKERVQQYFAYKRPDWRVSLLEEQLEKFGI